MKKPVEIWLGIPMDTPELPTPWPTSLSLVPGACFDAEAERGTVRVTLEGLSEDGFALFYLCRKDNGEEVGSIEREPTPELGEAYTAIDTDVFESIVRPLPRRTRIIMREAADDLSPDGEST